MMYIKDSYAFVTSKVPSRENLACFNLHVNNSMNWRVDRKKFLVLMAIGVVLIIYYCVNNPISISYHFGNMTEIGECLPGRSNQHLSLEPKVDRSHRSRDDIVRDAQTAMPNFPITFWERNKKKNLYYKNSSCARFPNVYNLRINNVYWQILSTKAATFYLFGAYYDIRDRCPICPVIRILGTIDRRWVKVNTFCQIWFADIEEPAIVESSKYFYFMQGDPPDPDIGHLSSYPALITCPIPKTLNKQVPIFVSLVERMCDNASNSLHVIFNKPNTPAEEKGFAVCVKTLDFPYEDQSTRLIEWIELMRLLGADKIIFYTLSVHKNMTKIFKYYEQKGVVELVPTTLVEGGVNMAHFQHLQLQGEDWRQRWMDELVQLNDCFYKNMYKYRYITALDMDEAIMPHKEYNWTYLMNTVLNETSLQSNIASYQTYMVIFPDCGNQTEPKMWYMLRHVLCDRSDLIQHTPKTFFDTKSILAFNNHRALACLTAECRHHVISRKYAELFHYRDMPYNSKQTGGLWSCEDVVRRNVVDTTIWKYKEKLLDRSFSTLDELRFYS